MDCPLCGEDLPCKQDAREHILTKHEHQQGKVSKKGNQKLFFLVYSATGHQIAAKII